MVPQKQPMISHNRVASKADVIKNRTAQLNEARQQRVTEKVAPYTTAGKVAA